MVELREPPAPEGPRPRSRERTLALVQIVLLGAVLATVLFVALRDRSPDATTDPESLRELASRLKAAGALDQSAELMARYLDAAELDPAARARVAYSLGQTYLERGRPEQALRWFYEAETGAEGALREEIARKVVHSLERMGRHHAAQAALESRVKLEPADAVEHPDSDPVVARVGEREIRRSEIDRALDEMGAVAGGRSFEEREQFLRRFVADELLYRKATKLEYDRDPEVTRALGQLAQRLVISRFVEQEVLGEIEVEEDDLENFFAAHRQRYQRESEGDSATLADVRPVVERDYLQSKAQAAYQELIDRELETAEVELFPERLRDG